jgi:hypothetical protein
MEQGILEDEGKLRDITIFSLTFFQPLFSRNLSFLSCTLPNDIQQNVVAFVSAVV